MPPPYEFRGPSGSIGFVNICEEYCQKRAECEYYVFDCKLSLCTMKMGNAAGSLVNSRYITGKKNNRAAKECQKEITTRFPPREPQPTAGSSLSHLLIELIAWLSIAGPNPPRLLAQIVVGGRGSSKEDYFLSSIEIFPTITSCSGVIPDLPEPR